MIAQGWRRLIANGARMIRLTIAGVILLSAVVGGLSGDFRTCETKRSTVGVETTCRPPAATDASVIAIGAMVALLLWPDLGEVGAFGLSLKRRVEQAEAKAEAVTRRASELEGLITVQQVRLDNVANASATSQSAIYIGDRALNQLQEGLPRKVEAFESGRQEDLSAVQASSLEAQSQFLQADDTADAQIELIRLTEELGAILSISPFTSQQAYDAVQQGSNTMSSGDRQRFLAIFSEELRLVMAARNAVTHAHPVSADELTKALDVAKRLVAVVHRQGKDKS
jgi:hypothetical protein